MECSSYLCWVRQQLDTQDVGSRLPSLPSLLLLLLLHTYQPYPSLFISPPKRLSSSLVSLISSYYPILSSSLSPPPPPLPSPCMERQFLALAPLSSSLSLYLSRPALFSASLNSGKVAASARAPFNLPSAPALQLGCRGMQDNPHVD